MIFSQDIQNGDRTTSIFFLTFWIIRERGRGSALIQFLHHIQNSAWLFEIWRRKIWNNFPQKWITAWPLTNLIFILNLRFCQNLQLVQFIKIGICIILYSICKSKSRYTDCNFPFCPTKWFYFEIPREILK